MGIFSFLKKKKPDEQSAQKSGPAIEPEQPAAPEQPAPVQPQSAAPEQLAPVAQTRSDAHMPAPVEPAPVVTAPKIPVAEASAEPVKPAAPIEGSEATENVKAQPAVDTTQPTVDETQPAVNKKSAEKPVEKPAEKKPEKKPTCIDKPKVQKPTVESKPAQKQIEKPPQAAKENRDNTFQLSTFNSQLAPAEPVAETKPVKDKPGFFARLRAGLKKTKEAFTYKISKLFTGGVLKDDFYDELETILLSADVGAECTQDILDELRDKIDSKHLRQPEDVRAALKEIVADILSENESDPFEFPLVLTIIGVNGVGKTTSIGKIAHMFRQQRKSVTIAAGDTFRAAASEQLKTWADRADCKFISQGEGSDPAAVVFDALKSVKSKGTDVLIIDTAGRLHNKTHLMEELKKIGRVVEREYPAADRRNFIVLDAVTGQNALSQVELFDEAVGLDGIILTKLDGTAKGGVILALCRRFSVPVVYVGVGEGVDDLQPFDPGEFAEALFSE